MSIFHILAFLAPLGIAAVIISAIGGLIFRFFGQRLTAFAPAAQFRLVFTAAILPFVLGTIFLIGATAGRMIYGETDLCLAREHTGHFSNFLVLFAVIFFGGVLWKIKSLSISLWKDQSIIKSLKNCSTGKFKDCRIIPLDEPQAFVLGIVKPEIYLSEGLLNKFDEETLETIIAHEKAHVQKRDPLRRFLAAIGLIFHLPATAKIINDQLSLTQELSADGDAARQTGSRTKLAQTLVGFARMRVANSFSVFEFGNSNVEIRVRRLLESDDKSDKISLPVLLLAGFAVLIFAIAFSRQLHLIFEIVLELF